MKKMDYKTKFLEAERARKALLTRCDEWNWAHYDLKQKYDVAIDRLHHIAAGFYPSDSNVSWSHQDKLMRSAALTLKQLASMKQRGTP